MTDPKHVAKAIHSPRGARATEIDWADGHKGVLPHEVLRGYCPCAGCQGHSGTIKFIEQSGIALEIPHECFQNCARVVGRPVGGSDRWQHIFQIVRFGSNFSRDL